MDGTFHEPVLLRESLDLLLTSPDGLYVDGTTGGGGHAEAICRFLSPAGHLVCFDADADAIEAGRRRLAPYGTRVHFVHGNTADIAGALVPLGITGITGILLDLGVSSYQLDTPAKGFSFRADGPLDMRMDTRQALTAGDVVNTYDETRLAQVLRAFGEEHRARAIAHRIVRHRPVGSTGALRDIVTAVAGQHPVKSLARVFQALRIEVNSELTHLRGTLAGALGMMEPGGRIVVISYHSLEDRIVKTFFAETSATHIRSASKYLPDTPVVPTMEILTRKPVVANDTECARNPRARSAKLRAARKR